MGTTITEYVNLKNENAELKQRLSIALDALKSVRDDLTQSRKPLDMTYDDINEAILKILGVNTEPYDD